MPRVARRARDVIIRVPKLLPYSKPSHAPNPAAGHEPGTTDPANATDASASAAQTVVSSGTASGTVAGASSTGASSSKDAGPGALIPQGEPGAAGAEGANGASAAAAALPQTQHVNLRGETSAAEWNSLLIWARRQRGPQWDTGTATWQVDKHSQEYYSYCSNPTQDILVQLDALNNPQHASTSAGATDTPSIAFNEGGGGGGGGVGSFESAHAQQQQPGGLLEAHQISGGAGGGVNPMQMMMIGNAGQQGRDEREDSPPVIAPGRSTRLRNWG